MASADVQEPLSKVDSATADEPQGPAGKRRTSSVALPGVYTTQQLQDNKEDLKIAPETQKLAWKVNTNPSKIDEPELLKLKLTSPPIYKIDLRIPLGGTLQARNKAGLTIKDVVDAIYKKYKKVEDDTLPDPYLRGFEWDKDENWHEFIIHFTKTPAVSGGGGGGGKKKKGKKGDDDDA